MALPRKEIAGVPAARVREKQSVVFVAFYANRF
jgi:hypothetical protein